jgi:hypothetical protein
MAVFSGRVIGTLILGHFLRTRAGRPGQGCALEWTTPFAAVHIHRPEAGYRLGSDRGSPNHGSTLLSKRVMAEIRSPVRVRT